MATPIADIVFWIAAIAIAVAQVMIVRSTRRGMRLGAPGAASWIEWGYAILPAIALAAVLAWTWHAMHPGVVHVEGTPPAVIGT